jgi:hypothetical protein
MTDMDTYPYPVHTNRELELMLAGRKPFAVFAHERVPGFGKADAIAGQDFAPHVAAGRLSEHLRTFSREHPGSPLQIDYWFYAVPGEEWRVEAFCLIIGLLHRGAWCPQLEWLEGTLLGYTEEQDLFHLSQRYGEEVALAVAGAVRLSPPR